MQTPPVVAITGATGLVGAALARHLEDQGRLVRRVVRGQATRPSDLVWDPARERIDAPALEGVDVVVHLAGESVAEGRWTEEKKRRIRESRVKGTRTLVRALAEGAARPRALVSASAIGFYGDRGDEWLDEGSEPGSDFLAGVCREWEAEACEAEHVGVRVARARLGIVLSPAGGALAKLARVFRLGGGGPVGDGRHFMSWISLRDVVAAFEWLIDGDHAGPCNLVSPAPVRNSEFSRELGRALRRPAWLPAPRFALRLALGEVATMLLASQRVRPTVLVDGAFRFADRELGATLDNLLEPAGARP